MLEAVATRQCSCVFLATCDWEDEAFTPGMWSSREEQSWSGHRLRTESWSRDVAACSLFSPGMHGLGQPSLVPLVSGASALAICCAGFEVGIHLFSRLYLAVESVQMDFLPLEEALQAQGLRSKASTTECSSRLYLSTTAISSSSKVNTAAVSSCLWSCMIYVFALSRVALVAFRVRFCKHACGCDGIIVSRPYGT